MEKKCNGNTEAIKDISKHKQEIEEAYYRKKIAEEKKQNSYHNMHGKYKAKDKLSSTWRR